MIWLLMATVNVASLCANVARGDEGSAVFSVVGLVCSIALFVNSLHD